MTVESPAQGPICLTWFGALRSRAAKVIEFSRVRRQWAASLALLKALRESK